MLLRGAKELHPEVADEVLKPLAEDDEFRRNSSLKSFWKMLDRDPVKVPADECYFVRIEGPTTTQTCTGLVLLQRSAQPTSRSPQHQFDIKGFCSSGAGKGTLLMFKLITFLRAQDSGTHLNVRLHKCTAAASGFYVKMGFKQMSKGPAKAGDSLFLDMSRATWKEAAIESMGGVQEVLDETAAVPVSTEDGLLQHLWIKTKVKKEPPEEKPSAEASADPSADPSAEASADPSAEVQKFGEGALCISAGA